MLTINDLSMSADLDRAAMRAVLGGGSAPSFPLSVFSILNAPTNDFGTHFLAQGQYSAIDQSHNLGGLNLVISDQTQHGIAGQVTK